MANPFASLSIKQAGLQGFTAGTGAAAIAIYDSACNRLQNVSMNTGHVGGSNVNIFTFASPDVVTTPFFYLGVSYEALGADLVQQDTGNFRGISDVMSNVHQVYSAANAATQPGGTGTTLTLPATCGALTPLTGASDALILVTFATN